MLSDKRINLKDEKGVALILSLILMTMLLLLTLSAFEMVTVNSQISDNNARDLQALYIAEAGIDQAIYQLRLNPNNFTNVSGTCGTGSYTATVAFVSSLRRSIISVGTIYSSTRSITAEVKYYKTSSPYTVVITSWKET